MLNISRKWVILIPLLIGVSALALLKQNRTLPVQEAGVEQATRVRVIEVPAVTVVPRAVGHGTVRPATTWEAVAEVKGKILDRHERLEKGAILEAGTRLLQIDPTEYELAIARAEADTRAIEAQLRELETRAENTRAALQIEQALLELNERELARKRELLGKGGLSRSDLESQEQALLAQRQKLQSQRNTLNLLPSQRALLEAQLASQQARLAAARRDLAQTRVAMPFTGRIVEVNVEEDQYVREGEVLAVVDGLQRAEVEAQIPIAQMGNLVRSEQEIDLMNMAGDPLPSLGLSAVVRLREGSLQADWPARFARISDTLDLKTRTVGVIIEVDQPYAGVRPGIRPPLFKGLFVQLDLFGRPRPDSLVIPRAALHQGRLRDCGAGAEGCAESPRVYLVNDEARLEIREVEVGLVQAEFVVITDGLQAGERVVISDLVPAIRGMLLQPLQDQAAEARLQRLASVGAPGA